MQGAFVLAAWLAGCQLPPGTPDDDGPDLSDRITFDGGDLDLESLPRLDGNQLPLDGGTSPFAHLILTVIDGETRLPVPTRVIFRPVPGAGFADSITSGTFDPLSPGGGIGAVVGPGVLGSPEGVHLVSGLGVVPVPPGTYTLLFSRGPEYELPEVKITVGPGDTRPINVQLDRTVDTRGWLSADMHVHLGRSFDSKVAADRRVVSMVTNDIQVIVATDHNVNTDLAPVAAGLGYGADLVGTVVGNEFNFSPGHAGAYPTPFDPKDGVGGAPHWQDVCTPPLTGTNCMPDTMAFPLMRNQIPGVTVVTLNHPYWPGADLGYFTNIEWGVGTANPPPAPLRSAGLFDAMEVLNGYQANPAVLDTLVADWFYLLGQGLRVAALGNSDTHRMNWNRGGFPRTWLRLPNDTPGDTTGTLLADAIRNGRAIASTGPFLDLTVDGHKIGDTIVPHNGSVKVDVSVDAPGWMKVDEVRVYVNGVLKHRLPVTPGARPVFQTSFMEPIAGDGWIVAVAEGKKPLPPDVVGEYSHGNGYEMTPWALTNPVFIDGNGDGAWHPPASPIGSGGPGPGPGMHKNKSSRPFDGKVPEICDPTELSRIGTEPPLEAPSTREHALMPHLFP
jgi:hypothetical protein